MPTAATATIDLLLGSILPPVVDWLTQKVPNTQLRYAISLAICALIAAALHFNELKAQNVDEVLVSLGIIFVGAQTTYNLYWKNTEAHDKLRPLKGR